MDDLIDFAEQTTKFASGNNFEYCDARVEQIEKISVLIENGDIENISIKEDSGIGIRLLADDVWSFFSISNPISFSEIREYMTRLKKTTCSKQYKNESRLSKSHTIIDKIKYPVKKEADLDWLIQIGYDCDKNMKSKQNISKTITCISTTKTAKYFTNSEGTKINQEYVDTVADLVATAHGYGLTQSVNTTEGGRGGIETISEKNEIISISNQVADNASKLLNARAAKSEKKPVVMNPDFVSLLTHEILGHPSEADRVLGKEMAWAGGAWWTGKIGDKIGSDWLNVFDDPTINGTFGHYKYDDEGNQASKTKLIENGVLENHLQSRETAKIFNTKATANMRATSYKFMPLIRMACTCIAGGDYSQQEMIKEVKDGFLISNMKIPSIDMKRYNWNISCQFANKIENGEVTDMVRDVIVIGTAPEFFQSIDACGNDFTIRPITNCGKGDPMQSMMMGNGGPSIRASATVKSV